MVEKQKTIGWGEAAINRISADLQDSFPQSTGFSPRNLRDMKRFYLAYSDESIWQQAVAKIPKSLISMAPNMVYFILLTIGNACVTLREVDGQP